MAAPTAAPAKAVIRRVPFERLSRFPPLFSRYAQGDAAALGFFEYDWRESAALDLAAERAAAVERDRDLLADVLHEQNTRWGNATPAVMSNLQALRGHESAVVVTGQQLGLFGGPLYTIYKIVTAIQLARRCQEESGRPVIPVFWLADEDHDWEEVRSTQIVHRNRPRSLELPPSGSREPVGRREVAQEIGELLAVLEDALPRSEHTAWVLASLRETYMPGSTVRDAFARWIGRLFATTGLVMISVDDARLKRQLAPLFQREIEDSTASLEVLLEASSALEAEGLHQQVAPAAGNIFLMESEGRLAVDVAAAGQFSLRPTGRTLTSADLTALLDREPERFSPNVVLRPVIEDALLPTAAYVAGPGEVSYYAQLGGIYRHFGVPMPVVYPRASVTVVEPKVRRVLDRFGLELEDLGDGSDEVLSALHARLALAERDDAPTDVFAEARAQLEAAADAVKPTVESVDPTLGRSTESVRRRLLQDLESLEKKVIRAQKRNHQQIRDGLDKAATHLFPGRRPQERVLSPLHFLNHMGPGFIQRLLDDLSLDTSEHQVLDL